MIRNISLIGSDSVGKTQLLEALAVITKTIPKQGSIEKRDRIGDTEVEEKERGITLNTTIASGQWNNTLFNFIDTPGFNDFFF